MRPDQLVVVLLTIGVISWFIGRSRSFYKASPLGGASFLDSLPSYYGFYTALWAIIPSLTLILVWSVFQTPVTKALVLSSLPEPILASNSAERLLQYGQISNLAKGVLAAEFISDDIKQAAVYFNQLTQNANLLLTLVCMILSFSGLIYALVKIEPEFRARNKVERAVNAGLLMCASVAILTTLGIILSVLFESIRFFRAVSFFEFAFSTHWSPQSSINFDQVASGNFGAVPLFTGTLLISLIAMIVAVPTGLMIAIYLGEYAHLQTRSLVKPLIEMLAGIPTVVYGFVAALTVAPLVRAAGESIGLSTASESALAAGLVMGVMIIPFVSSLSDDVIRAVPQSLRDGALALGATKSEMIRQILFPAALPGIMGAILLAVSRAIGETMIVVMAAGLAAKMTSNPLDAVTTITVQIVALLTGDQEFDSPKTLAAL